VHKEHKEKPLRITSDQLAQIEILDRQQPPLLPEQRIFYSNTEDQS